MRTTSKLQLHRILRLPLAFALIALLPGCGLLIGNVKPVSEKSETYRVMDLTREGAEWEKIEGSAGPSEEEEPVAIPDLAFQSRNTASVISLNSACRPRIQATEQTLKEFTDQLFLGVDRISSKVEREITAAGIPALETTASGRMNGEDVKIRTVVLREGRCIYDLTYIARPEHFPKDEVLFSQFVASLRLR